MLQKKHRLHCSSSHQEAQDEQGFQDTDTGTLLRQDKLRHNGLPSLVGQLWTDQQDSRTKDLFALAHVPSCHPSARGRLASSQILCLTPGQRCGSATQCAASTPQVRKFKTSKLSNAHALAPGLIKTTLTGTYKTYAKTNEDKQRQTTTHKC